MELYVFENYKELFLELSGSALTDALIRMALSEYGVADADILRTDKGKPYIATGEVCISVSHSGCYFICAIDKDNIGVDVQEERRTNREKISQRYFTDKEAEFVMINGNAGFFTLWTRKEAYSKYTGRGMEDILKVTSVLDRCDVDFFDFQLEKGIYCSCCTKKIENR